MLKNLASTSFCRHSFDVRTTGNNRRGWPSLQYANASQQRPVRFMNSGHRGEIRRGLYQPLSFKSSGKFYRVHESRFTVLYRIHYTLMRCRSRDSKEAAKYVVRPGPPSYKKKAVENSALSCSVQYRTAGKKRCKPPNRKKGPCRLHRATPSHLDLFTARSGSPLQSAFGLGFSSLQQNKRPTPQSGANRFDKLTLGPREQVIC